MTQTWQSWLFVCGVVATDFVLATYGAHYVWHITAACAWFAALGYWIRVPDWPLSRINTAQSLRFGLRVSAIIAVLCIALVAIAIVVIRVWDLRFEFTPQNIRHPDEFWGWCVFAMLWAPISEELTYRGLIYPHMRRALGPAWAITLNGLVFWVLHWFYFGGVTMPNHLLGGLVFAWSYERTRSLLAPMLIHAMSNFYVGLSNMWWHYDRATIEALFGWR